jgi:nucleotide-binding universal stress UspA family protein
MPSAPSASVDPAMTEQRESLRDAALPPGTSPNLVATTAKPRLLCATDSSRHSPKVMARAVMMASQLDAKLALLQVIGTGQEGRTPASERTKVRLKSMRPPVRDEPVVHLHAGDYLPVIVAIADEADADLVVLDSKPWRPLLSPLAATAGELAAQVRRPVLIVKRDSQAPYKSVLIAAERSTAFDQLLRTLSSWRLLECDSVAIIHGFESPYRGLLYAAGLERLASRRNTDEWELAARRSLLRSLDDLGVAHDHFRVVFAQSRPIREIRREVRRVGPDLLVIATAHHAAVDRIMRASVGNDLLRNIECDILAVPMPVS